MSHKAVHQIQYNNIKLKNFKFCPESNNIFLIYLIDFLGFLRLGFSRRLRLGFVNRRRQRFCGSCVLRRIRSGSSFRILDRQGFSLLRYSLVNEWINKWVSEWWIKSQYEWNEGLHDWLHEWMNAWTTECMIAWILLLNI